MLPVGEKGLSPKQWRQAIYGLVCWFDSCTHRPVVFSRPTLFKQSAKSGMSSSVKPQPSKYLKHNVYTGINHGITRRDGEEE